MTPELQERWRANQNLWTWLAGAFGLAIVLGAAFLTGYLRWPTTQKPKDIAAKVKPPITGPETSPASPTGTSRVRNQDTLAAGDLALAKLWAGIEPAKLAAITATWKPSELAPILLRMKSDQVTELLAAMKPERASQISREIRLISARQG